MRAVGFLRTGGPEVLEVLELPDPIPGPGELRIRVHAAAVNPTDTGRRAGNRPPANPDLPQVPGMDVAGVLEEVGPDAQTDLGVGDHVMAVVVPSDSHGAYAEQVVVPAESVVAVPAGASDVEASTLPMNGLTARLALDALALPKASVLVVSGAAGALGGYVVQLAKADGLTVVADASGDDEALVSRLGAGVVLPRGAGFGDRVRERYPDGADGAVDTALLHDAIAPAVKDGATVVTVRGYDQPGERGVVFQPVLVMQHAREHAKLDALRRQAEDGTLTLRVAQTFPLDQAAEAHRRLEAGGVRGRLVLEF